MEDKGKLRKALKRRDKSKEKSATKWAAISKVCAQLEQFCEQVQGPGTHTQPHARPPFPVRVCGLTRESATRGTFLHSHSAPPTPHC